MAEPKDDYVLDVPREWMCAFNGFALDIGGSVIKIIYRHKQDWQDLKDSTNGRLRFISFSRGDIDAAIDFLDRKCHVTGSTNDVTSTVYTTGAGGFQFSKVFSTKFNVKIENVMEFDAFVKGFLCALATQPQEKLFHPVCIEAERSIQAFAKLSNDNFTDMGDTSGSPLHPRALKAIYEKELGDPETGLADPEDVFPCMLAMVGSGIGIMMVNKDGSFKMQDVSSCGGRSFMAMGSLLTGAKTYDELTELAARGEPNNVHFTIRDYSSVDSTQQAQGSGEGQGKEEEQEKEQKQDQGQGQEQEQEQKQKQKQEQEQESLYAKVGEMKDESYFYLMGKAVGKDVGEFRREDLAAALLQTAAVEACQFVHVLQARFRARRVFWCGSFIKAEVVRRYITLEWRRRAVTVGLFTGECEWIPSHFLTHGPYLGALGCVIKSVDQFLKKPSEVAAEKQAAADEKQAAADEKQAAADEKQAAADAKQAKAGEKPAAADAKQAAADEKQAAADEKQAAADEKRAAAD